MSLIAPLNPVERAQVTQGVAAQFRGRPIDFAGGVTCIHLFAAQLEAFGYSVPPIPHFTTPIGAKRALRKMGHHNLESLIDSMLPRIAPAQMRVGDVVMGPGAGLFAAIGISAGGKVLGWAEDGSGLHNIILHGPPLAAWKLM